MRTVDFIDPCTADDAEGEAVYLVLAPEATYRFRWERGNLYAWHELSEFLAKRLPGCWQEGLGDVSVNPRTQEVTIDARCGTEGAERICRELITRELVPPSAPVLLSGPRGDELLGPAGAAAARPAYA